MAESKENLVWKLLEDLSAKKGISEIIINGPKNIFVERDGRFIQLNAQLSKNDIYSFVDEVAKYNKKQCDSNSPILDGNLPDGSRVNVIVEPFSFGAPAITIRKYLREIRYFGDVHNVFGLDPHWVDFFRAAVVGKTNIVVSGGTGAGKTTFLNMLLNEMPVEERVVTIEDTLELQFECPNLVRLEAGGRSLASTANIQFRDLVKNTLRMRPDRVVVGEARGGEFFDLLQAMNTGHEGSMTSIHANSPGECLQRMETLYLLAGFEVPHEVVRRQISTAIDFVVQIVRNRQGQRYISSIQEITGMEGDRVLSQEIATEEEGLIKSTGITPECLERLHQEGGLAMDFFSTIDTVSQQ